MLPKILVLATAAGFAAGGWLCLCPPGKADDHACTPGDEPSPAAPHECRCPDTLPAAAEPARPAQPLAMARLQTPGLRPPTPARPRPDRTRGSPPGQYSTDALYLDHAVLRR